MTLQERIKKWKSNLKSYRIALKVSGSYGRCTKLRQSGQLREALVVARSGLAHLSAPSVLRKSPAVTSLRLMLTIQVEQLGYELGEPGANPTDLADTAAFLRAMPDSAKRESAEIKREWLPYIEARLASIRNER